MNNESQIRNLKTELVVSKREVKELGREIVKLNTNLEKQSTQFKAVIKRFNERLSAMEILNSSTDKTKSQKQLGRVAQKYQDVAEKLIAEEGLFDNE